jgi:catalase (peroxidase I)
VPLQRDGLMSQEQTDAESFDVREPEDGFRNY